MLTLKTTIVRHLEACARFSIVLIGLVHVEFSRRSSQSRKKAFEERKRELKALGLGQDGRPLQEREKTKSRGKVQELLTLQYLHAYFVFVFAFFISFIVFLAICFASIGRNKSCLR